MILTIGRNERFSPNSADKDAAILDSVGHVLRREGYDVRTVSEDALGNDDIAEAYLSMGRSAATVALLEDRERKNSLVVNSSAGVVLCCHRRRLMETLRLGGIPIPPEEGIHGYWLKKGSGVTESKHDVQYASCAAEVPVVMARMRARGLADVMVSAHVTGDLVKFYGVRYTDFFRFYYPGDDGQTKFGDEQRNGLPHHYPFDERALRDTAETAAVLAGVDVYGGDCIIGSDGSLSIIDFNDWPSFSRCREEAADAIVRMVVSRMACRQMKKRA